MKTKTIIEELNHDDLVNLFSTALYGSWTFCASYDSAEYHALPNADGNDCYEDKLAKLLLAGKSIEIGDRYAEDESDHYGKLQHKWDDDEEVMVYNITLKDIIKGLQIATDKGGWTAKCVRHFADEDGLFDLLEAEALLQVVIFGEVIYG